MSNLATIVNNILADSGIDDINVVVTTGSYSNPSWITALSWTKITDRPTTLAGYGITDAYTQTQVNTLLANYVPYSGATSSVNLGTHTLSANNLIANGGFNSGSLMLKPGTGAQTINLDYFTLTPSGTTSINFGFSTGASTWKSFSFSSVLLTNNTPTVFTLPNGGGTIAVVGGSGVGTVTSVAALTLGTSGTDLSSSVANGTTTPVITLNVPTASAANRGALSAADWTTFNNKQNALTNPVTGTGTTNYIPKFTGTSTIGNSAIQDDGSSVLIGRETFITGTNAYFQVGNAAGATGKFQIESTSGAAIIGTRDDSSILFRTNLTTKLTLNSSGNLGLGVTPSAWGSGFNAMQIGLGTSLYNNSNTNGTFLGSNFFFNGSNNIYIGTGTATAYVQSLGTHAWFTAPSGTAGNAISFTQAMTLTAAGRLLINTPTESTFHLDVNGTGRFSQTGAVPLTVVRTSANSNVGIRYQNNTTSWYSGLASDDSFSVSFNDPNLATGQFKLTTTGAATFSSSVTATGLTISSNGSNGGILGVDDGGLAISSRGSTPIAFWTNGFTDQRMRITSGGNVGIGNTTPDSYTGTASTRVLAVGSTTGNNGVNVISGTTSTGSYMFSDSGGNDRGGLIYFHTADLMTLTTAGTEKIRITSGGNVLIGTTTDNGARLQVSGTATIAGNTRITSVPASSSALTTISSDWANGATIFTSINLGSSGDLSVAGVQLRAYSNYAASFGTEFRLYVNSNSNVNTEALRIASTGAATFSSSVTAVDFSATKANAITYQARSGASNAYTYMSIGRTTSELEIGVAGNVDQFFDGAAAGDAAIKANGLSNKLFLGYGQGSPTMTLTSTRNVGIGTTSPSYPLTVGTAGTTANSYIQIASSTTGAGSLYFGDTAGVGVGSYAGFVEYAHSSNTMVLGTASTTRLTITSSGNLGLGVTPSAWSSGGRIEIGNDKTIVAQGPNILLGTNLYFNSGFKYVTTGASTYYYQTDGTHKWYQAPSGTAGNAISFTQAMTLFATGNLLVGSPSPISDNGARLQVSGTSSLSGRVGVNTATVSGIQLVVQGENNGSVDFGLVVRNSSSANLFSVRNDGLVSTGTSGSILTGAPYGTTALAWKLGRFLTETASVNGSIRVQIGTRYYNIAAQDLGEVPS